MGLASDQTTDAGDSVDLAALGKTWTRPHDLDTSPEVSDVIAKMPRWATRGVLYIIVTFIIVGVVWASLSKVDVVVEGRGTLVPEGHVKPVQAAGSGVVQNVFVKEGDTVERGQALVQLAASETRTRLTKLREELETSQLQLRQLMVNRPVGETLEQQNRIARLQSEIAAAELTLQHTTLTAPVSGIITILGVRGSGEVLQPGQTIATIAPTGVHLVVEVQLPNKDIAFIEKGLPAKLKFDAFPFQDYGVVEGTVIDVSPDAQVDKESGSSYKVTITPRKTEIAAKGKNVPLRPGLAVSAEIITERKSILSLLLEPFRRLKGDVTR
jgi:multidrug efflux pump subunit AcrA (membrane-fusion protein)